MFEIQVTIACPDLVAAANILAKCAGTAPAAVNPTHAPVAAPTISPMPATNAPVNTPTVAPISAPAPVAPAPVATTVPLASAPTFTLEQVCKAGADLIGRAPHLLPQANAMLAQYGVQSLSELKPDQLGAVATALRGMGASI